MAAAGEKLSADAWRDTPSSAFSAVAGALTAAAVVGGVLPPVAVLAPAALGLRIFRRPAAILAAAAFLAVLVSAALREHFAETLPERDRPAVGVMKIELVDPRVSQLLAPGETPRLLRAELREFAAPGAPEPQRFARGIPVLVAAPPDSVPGRYGSCYEATGMLSPISPSQEGFVDDRFLLRQARSGIRAVCRVGSWRAAGREKTLRGFLLDSRDALLETLLRGVADPGVRRLAAALYCGVASGVPALERRDFSAAGIVHIFSVSGMHVAVLALCFFRLLYFLPFRVRHAVLVLLVWLYVLGTGAGTPAVRAGMMITLWSLLRLALLRLPGMQILYWTAALLLIADPAVVSSAGAQYSFLITAALLALAERRNRWRFVFRAAADYLPWRERSFAAAARRSGGRTAALFRSAGTAFLAGAAVSLYIGTRRLSTGAVAANILLALLMPGYFALFFIQLLMGAFGMERFTAPLFEFAFRRLRDFAAFFGDTFPAAAVAPPHWSVGVGYIFALLTALCARRRPVRLAAWSATALIIAAVCLRPRFMPPALLIRSGGSGRPALVAVAEPARERGVIVNLPDPADARIAAEFLWARGIRELDVLGSSGPGGISGAALRSFAREMKIRRHAAPDGGSDLFRIAPRKNGFRLDYFDPGSKLYFDVVVSDGDDGRTVVVERSGKSTLRHFPWSIRPENWEHEFSE